jgi:thioesterase domain-containing protein/acyl carrier protein
MFLGRIDNQVKLRGFRIELGEVEAILAEHEAVKESIAMVREDDPGNQQLVSYVIVDSEYRKGESLPPAETIPGHSTLVPELKRWVKERLPDYMVPSVFVVLDSFPLTPNGKVDRRALPAPEFTRDSKAAAPRDELERLLSDIWQRVLGIEPIGIRDNFFELGGHSLAAVRLMAEIQKASGKTVPLAELFRGATIEHLADVLREETTVPEQMVVQIQRGGSQPPFFAIVTPGMNALGYVALARHLGAEQPVCKIQAPGPRLKGRPYSAAEFEQMAAEYIRAMKSVQPAGPYYFGGMCEGARIAFDMARLLEARGEQVALLAIFDTWVIENSQIRYLWKIDYYSGRIKEFRRLSPSARWETIRGWWERRSNYRKNSGNGSRSLWPSAYWPGKDFVPCTYGGRITVFKMPKQPYYYVRDPYMGWGSRTTRGVDLQVIDVHTRSHVLLLREPYVRQIAQKLGDCLRRARAEHTPGEVTEPAHVSAD